MNILEGLYQNKKVVGGILLLLVVSISFVFSCSSNEKSSVVKDDVDTIVEKDRIVNSPSVISLAPVFTEVLYALGLGDNIMAVSDECDFPSDAKALPKIGSPTKPNIDKILKLKPDYVVCFSDQEDVKSAMTKASIKCIECSISSLDAISSYILEIAGAFDAIDPAECWLMDYVLTLELANKKANLLQPKPSIIVVLKRDEKNKDEVLVCGEGLFYNDIINAVGGVNAFKSKSHAEKISLKEIQKLNPDIIIDLPSFSDDYYNAERDDQLKIEEKVVAEWRHCLGEKVSAVEKNKVFVIADAWARRPGVRIVKTIEKFSEIVVK